jgi:HAD superfamily hydrolase (TIGR01509 family)
MRRVNCDRSASIEESIRDYMGGTLARVRSTIRERSGQDLPTDFDESYHQRLFEAFSTDLRPVLGIQSVLDGLELPFCVASSGTLDRIVRSLTVTGLIDYFGDRIFSAEQVANGKPAPDLFLHVASSMAIPTSHCVVVEDSPNGVAAARAAGMTVLGYVAMTPAERLGGADATFARRRRPGPGLEAGVEGAVWSLLVVAGAEGVELSLEEGSEVLGMNLVCCRSETRSCKHGAPGHDTLNQL